ncbi:YwiC-like family protein [Bifidobacterium sp. ESL0728]|uniref:YwiC-like family protein n=1 Tax=Bifidobacterium sp. ESL0728 TaxID=2983220 RepID=UPI0023FA45AE|nr:YwiC-like family protein [Bifidobacterium sp. ESL0728]WEV59216.1 YwiC-like family protein [Bifidobacterium sp. ESL0728]
MSNNETKSDKSVAKNGLMRESENDAFPSKGKKEAAAAGEFRSPLARKTNKAATKPPHHTNIWLPDQPGAWVMALFPAVGGAIISGICWRNVWLLVAWTLCYCFQFSAARWLAVRSHEAKDARKRRSNIYFVPAAVYLIATAVVGIPVFIFAPRLLWWIPAYAILAALSFVAAWLRRERTLWGNAVAVIAAGGMALLTASLGSKYFVPATPHESLASRLSPILALNSTVAANSGNAATMVYQGNSPSVSYFSLTSQYFLDSPLLPKAGVIAALTFILTEYASVVFVKTMFRKYGNHGYYALSIIYHAILAALGFLAPTLLQNLAGLAFPHGAMAGTLLWGIASTLLLLIAIIAPHHKRMKAMQVGGIEAGTSLMNLIVIVATLA